jgi:signal transduction histidine kinase
LIVGSAVTPRPGQAASQIENALMAASILFRAGGLVGMAVVVVGDAGRYRGHWLPAACLLAAVVAESGLLAAAGLRSRRIGSVWATADLVFTMAALVAGAEITAAHTGRLFYMYPYTMLTSITFGVAYRRLSAVLAATIAMAGTYAVAVLTLRHGQENVTINSLSYFTNTVVAWAVARLLRRNGAELDDARPPAAALAPEAEPTPHARILHDYVLQTLETVVGRRAIADGELHAQVAADADWLRAFVAGVPTDHPGDLLWRLQELIHVKARIGLKVEFSNAHLLAAAQSRRHLPPHITEAVVGAVHEALTNVAKHARTNTATLRAKLTDTELVVSVLDRGAGFDPNRAPLGVGLGQSISERIREIGGVVHIDSSFGEGTYIEMRIPVGD